MAFWDRVDERGEDECWPWTGAVAGGYGSVNLSNVTSTTAHRVMYSASSGIPLSDLKGKVVVQTCRNKLCCNPAHLKLRSKRRGPRGSANGMTGLTPEKVRRIKKRSKQGWTQARLAKRFDTTQATISRILSGKVWKHVV